MPGFLLFDYISRFDHITMKHVDSNICLSTPFGDVGNDCLSLMGGSPVINKSITSPLNRLKVS